MLNKYLSSKHVSLLAILLISASNASNASLGMHNAGVTHAELFKTILEFSNFATLMINKNVCKFVKDKMVSEKTSVAKKDTLITTFFTPYAIGQAKDRANTLKENSTKVERLQRLYDMSVTVKDSEVKELFATGKLTHRED